MSRGLDPGGARNRGRGRIDARSSGRGGRTQRQRTDGWSQVAHGRNGYRMVHGAEAAAASGLVASTPWETNTQLHPQLQYCTVRSTKPGWKQ